MAKLGVEVFGMQWVREFREGEFDWLCFVKTKPKEGVAGWVFGRIRCGWTVVAALGRDGVEYEGNVAGGAWVEYVGGRTRAWRNWQTRRS